MGRILASEILRGGGGGVFSGGLIIGIYGLHRPLSRYF